MRALVSISRAFPLRYHRDEVRVGHPERGALIHLGSFIITSRYFDSNNVLPNAVHRGARMTTQIVRLVKLGKRSRPQRRPSYNTRQFGCGRRHPCAL